MSEEVSQLEYARSAIFFMLYSERQLERKQARRAAERLLGIEASYNRRRQQYMVRLTFAGLPRSIESFHDMSSMYTGLDAKTKGLNAEQGMIYRAIHLVDPMLWIAIAA